MPEAKIHLTDIVIRRDDPWDQIRVWEVVDQDGAAFGPFFMREGAAKLAAVSDPSRT